jgi:hypothetical protein
MMRTIEADYRGGLNQYQTYMVRQSDGTNRKHLAGKKSIGTTDHQPVANLGHRPSSHSSLTTQKFTKVTKVRTLAKPATVLCQ